MRNKDSNTKGSPPYVIKSDFPYLKELLLKERMAPSGIKFFPLREVPILKRDVIVDKHCMIQQSSFDVRNFFSVLATPLLKIRSYHSYESCRVKRNLYYKQVSMTRKCHNYNHRPTLGTLRQRQATVMHITVSKEEEPSFPQREDSQA